MTSEEVVTGAVADPQIERVVGMCLELQERFGWERRSPGYRVEARWASRTADFFLCHGLVDGAPVAVIKVLARERKPEPQAVHAILKELAAIHRESAVVTARPPRALGWMLDPAALAMEHLPGESGPALVRRCLSTRDIGSLEAFVRICGATLSAWHNRWGIARTDGPGDEAYRRLSRAARRQGIRLRTILPGDTRLQFVRRFRDFSVYNTQHSGAGEVVLLDPPSSSGGWDLACRDIAWFLSSIAAVATGTTGTQAEDHTRILSAFADVRDRVARSFVGGYADGTGCPLADDELRAAALLEGAFLLARSAGNLRRDPTRAARLARLAWQARKRALG